MICKYKKKDNILFQIFPETLSDIDFCLLNEEFETIENKYSTVLNRIVDLNNLKKYHSNFNSIYEYVQRRIEKRYPNMIFLAFLVSSDFQMEYARMFQLLNDNLQISTKIFTDEVKAIEWINSDDTHLNQQLKLPERALHL
jgi:hypothetical protein